ncbi:hypothetical protein [Streptomyces coffeae]|uniref:Uncharacterized protein n=1 Tax=Streptomyces coffeae TaxID=621382 RepID=A0ABS1NAD6_9ACTN|nr:hypothetical protein [Streptomyces coffeae]MBL1097047.1 hypothetical protein [Streptomyces coffeae]
MPPGYQQADPSTPERWRRLADQVCTHLAAAGLPVIPEMDFRVSAGAQVDIDPGGDSAGGVYVGWRAHPWLWSAFVDGARQQHPQETLARHLSGLGEAMRDAIDRILTTGGFTVGPSPNDLAQHLLYVSAGPDQPLAERLGLD